MNKALDSITDAWRAAEAKLATLSPPREIHIQVSPTIILSWERHGGKRRITVAVRPNPSEVWSKAKPVNDHSFVIKVEAAKHYGLLEEAVRKEVKRSEVEAVIAAELLLAQVNKE